LRLPWRTPYYADRLTAEALAGFLRAYSDAWRVRRFDRFVPLDFHLVEHQATLQGQISWTLIERFRELHSSQHRETAHWRLKNGLTLPLLLPVFGEAKKLLHEFSVRDEGGEALPMLTRGESAAVSAAYVYTALRTTSPAPRVRVTNIEAATLLLTTLGYINPRGASGRFDQWTTETGRPEQTLVSRVDAPILDPLMLEWVEHEANAVVPRVGTLLRTGLTNIPQWESLPINAAAGSSLKPYAKVDALLLYGIRDLVKMVLNGTPLWEAANRERNPRSQLAHDPAALALEVLTQFVRGFAHLAELVRTAAPEARAEFDNFLGRYTAYVYADVELGRPFLIKVSQVLPVGGEEFGKREFLQAAGQTRIRCPLALKDAGSVHVAVALRDPEVRFGLNRLEVNLRGRRFIRVGRWQYDYEKKRPLRLGRRRVEEWSLLYRPVDGEPEPVAIDRYFGLQSHASEQLIHFYSGRGRYESRQADHPLGSVDLLVPLKLTLTIFWAYAFSVLFFVAAAAYAGAMWSWGIAHARSPANLEAVVVVNALAITLSLWLTTTQHRRPVVHKKLLPARYAFFAAMLFLLLAPAAFGSWEVYHLFST
jgi:hypothetical protein